MNLQISPQLMDEMIEEALHHVNRKSCEHTITTQYGDEILLVNVDARLIMQVVVNLVDNAIKYTPAGSVIQISAYRKDHQVVVEVAQITVPAFRIAQKHRCSRCFIPGRVASQTATAALDWACPLPCDPDGSRRNIDPA